MFLETLHNITDFHFTGKDVAYIVSFLITVLTAWFKLKHDNDRHNERIKIINEKLDICFADAKEEMMNAKNGRASIRKDFDRKLEKTSDEIKETKENFTGQMSEMTASINEVKTDTAEIKGMINSLLNR
jgi:F0F1-type ATP synthase membrane subunit b/b'